FGGPTGFSPPLGSGCVAVGCWPLAPGVSTSTPMEFAPVAAGAAAALAPGTFVMTAPPPPPPVSAVGISCNCRGVDGFAGVVAAGAAAAASVVASAGCAAAGAAAAAVAPPGFIASL